MSSYRAEPHLEGLADFQRRSVDHVIEQFYERGAKRFLVADETGLGKTRVAQGVIARAIETLQDDDRVERIDIVYVCSNADLAKQNIRRLNVTGDTEIPLSSRLTLLAEHSRRLKAAAGPGKPVNLVSFTPGMSFDMGHSLGQARERAMILIALAAVADLDRADLTAAHQLLQGQVRKLDTFRDTVKWLWQDIGEDGLDPTIVKEFDRLLAVGEEPTLWDRFCTVLQETRRRQAVPKHVVKDKNDLVRDLRGALAAASVHTLEPDLVILDEFQRFRHLLDPGNPAGELAHHLFEYEAAKVLLLSATPYKPFTFAEEKEEDHARDLFKTLGFLAAGRDDVDVSDIRAGLQAYRQAVERGAADQDARDQLRGNLLKLMSRAERPVLPEGSMTREHRRTADDVRATDLVGYARLRTVAGLVGRPRDHGLVTAEYWKSAPYFINFCDGYQLGKRLDESPVTPEVRAAAEATQRIVKDDLVSFQELDPGNARMRALVEDTVGRGWWQLLWVPPSLPYLTPTGVYADAAAAGMTKRLVFSSWAATPAAVASVLSFEAERRMAEGSRYTSYTPDGRKYLTKHLQYVWDNQHDRPRGMATLLLHWPFRSLASIDPLALVAEHGGSTVTIDAARAAARNQLSALLRLAERVERSTGDESGLRSVDWQAAFGMPGSWPADADHETLAATLAGDTEEAETAGEITENQGDRNAGLRRHLDLVSQARESETATVDNDTLDLLVDVALFAPGTVCYRVIRRLLQDGSAVTPRGLWEAAATLANGLRSLFNRPDVTQIVERAGGERTPYWRKVLAYCADGNLEAVLDEYLHHLQLDRIVGAMDDGKLLGLATEAAAAVSLKPSTYRAKDPTSDDGGLSFVGRFALGYGSRDQKAEDARQPEVRRSFNSPFWPMVLASTSVGQEGIDFHWWCHAVFHWNTPPNPVDFEQREGRVDRYRGHAVRKNIASRHGKASLAELGGNPWDRLYELARDRQSKYGEFTPGWVYPGEAKIERHVVPFPLSSDQARYERIKRDVALYRLTFGQPRQEDMLEVLRRRGVDADPELIRSLRIDLAP